jgi:hypothetical protein
MVKSSAPGFGHSAVGARAGPVIDDPAAVDAEIGSGDAPVRPDRYKWVVLSNTTLGVLMATIDLSIMLIALPNIFRGIHIDPLAPGNSFYLLWMILGFLVVTSVLVVTLGRLGDIYGRKRLFIIGMTGFTVASAVCGAAPLHDSSCA